MLRVSLVIAIIALILGIGALILQFTLPSGESTNNAVIKTLREQIKTLQASSVRVAYVNVDDAGTVLTAVVQDLQNKRDEKKKEIDQLKQEYLASAISKEEFETRSTELQTELAQAQLNIYVSLVDKMLVSNYFTNIRTNLQQLREQVQPVIDETKQLVATVRVGVIAPQEFATRLGEVQNALMQIDQAVKQALAFEIVQAAKKVAQNEGYEFVLKANEVVAYADTAKVADITEKVKRELASYL
jgi:Skp family chaperone for outer membrane proteins